MNFMCSPRRGKLQVVWIWSDNLCGYCQEMVLRKLTCHTGKEVKCRGGMNIENLA
jgi:hypothetical protein